LDHAVRILFTFAGGTGHFLPLAPVALAAERAGHVVAFAGQEGMVATVEAAGFTAFASGGASLLTSEERLPLLALDTEREARAIRSAFAGRIARERADALVAIGGHWSPDIIVRDEIDFGAAVAAERLGVTDATVLCIASGIFVPTGLVLEPLTALREIHGLPPDPDLEMLHRNLVLSPFPPSFRDPAVAPAPNTHAFQAIDPELSAHVAETEWLAALPRPVTYLTLGTIFNLESGDLFERVLAGLRDLPGSIVVTVGRDLDPGSLGPQSTNVHVRRFIPQSLVLPHCDLVVSHAGSGSVIGALTHGLPMVLLPMGADQPLNAGRAEALGVAQVLDALEATPGQIQRAAVVVMSEAGYRRNAGLIRDEIRALPGPERAVELIEQLG
jgi:UDP:flavonoid glycosyltransferase YjiC (YdhE family)